MLLLLFYLSLNLVANAISPADTERSYAYDGTRMADSSFDIKLFEDTTASLEIDDVIRMDQAVFEPVVDTRFGFTKSAYWLKVTNTNNTPVVDKRVLEFLDPRLDFVYYYDDKGELLSLTGDKVPFTQRTYNDPDVALSIPGQPGRSVYFIKVLNTSKMNIEHALWNEHEYLGHLDAKNLSKAFYFGALVIMLLYNLILYFFIRDRAILEYVLYHVALMYVMIYYNGISAQLFFRDEAGLDASTVAIHYAAICTLLATQFLRSFLNTKVIAPNIDKTLLLFIGLNAISILLSVFDAFYHVNHLFFNITMMVQSIYLVFAGFYISIARKSKLALFYFVGWFTMMIAIVITALIIMSVIPRNSFTSNIFQVGSLIEVLLLSMGLAYRYKESREAIMEKDRALEEINANLEVTIRERTMELANEVQHTKSLLDDREILFKELYHRVKNNLQMLTSLLSMQQRRLDDEKSKGVLQEFIGRIKSLALMHEKLQSSDKLDGINMQEYLRSLLEEMKNASPFAKLELALQSRDIFLKIDQVTPIGLIINELVSNSFKHAFKEVEAPKIEVHLKELNDTHLELFYSDNGKVVSDPRRSASLGTVLIDTLGRSQLKGEIVTEMNPSLSYRIVFPK